MFGWLKTLTGAGASAAGGKSRAGASPSATYALSLAGDDITLDYPGQPAVKAALSDVAEVVVETGEEDPAFWWLLLGAKGDLLMAFPGGATGEDALVARLKALPGFDDAKFADAEDCDISGDFVVWKRS